MKCYIKKEDTYAKIDEIIRGKAYKGLMISSKTLYYQLEALLKKIYMIYKKEEVNRVIYYDFASARLALFKYIEGSYNKQRIHKKCSKY